MLYHSRRAVLTSDEDVDHLRDLHTLTFDDTSPMAEFDYGDWWLVFPAGSPEPVAFAGVVASTMGEGTGYLKRAGVLEGHRGHGIQRRLLRMREAMGRRHGWHLIVTDTTTDNPHSSNNLIRAGYELFTPKYLWGLKSTLYWRKHL